MPDIGTEYKLDISGALASLDQLASKEAALRAAIVQSGQEEKRLFTEAAQRAIERQRLLTQNAIEIRNANLLYKQQRDELRALLATARDLEKAAKQAGGSTEKGRELAAERKRNQAAQQALSAEIERTKQGIDEERAAQAKLRQEQQASVNQQKLATAAAKDTAAAGKQAAQSAKEAARAANDQAGGAGGFFKGLLGQITGVAGGLFTVSKLMDSIQTGLNDYADITGVQATLQAVAGSAAAGATEYQYVREQVQLLGLELVPTAKAYAGLFAAAKEANIPIEQTRDIFEGVSRAARTLGLSTADTEGVLRAVQQMLSKGTVSAEELRGQLGERLPGAFEKAAASIGVTTQELDKMLRKGQVVAVDFLPKFAAELKRSYGDATADAAGQVRANLGRINSFLVETSARFGAVFAPAIAALAKLVSGSETAVQKSERLASAYFKQAEATAAVKDTVTPLLTRYEQLSQQTTRNAQEQQELTRTIDELAKIVPTAVTQFDSFGRALGINGTAVRKYQEDLQDLAKAKNKTAIEATGRAIVQLGDQRRALQKALAAVDENGLRTGQVVTGAGQLGGATTQTYTLSREESAKITEELRQRLLKTNKDIRGQVLLLDELEGRALKPPKDLGEPERRRLGLILTLQQKIADLRKQQEAEPTTENDLLRKGGLNDQIKAAQAELDRLLGKQETARKRKGPDYLKQLLAEEERLRKEANQVEIEQLKDQGQARAAEQLRQDRDTIDRTEATLRRLEQLAGRDGTIDGVQQAQLASLRSAALDRYYATLYTIAQQANQRLQALRENTDAQELREVEDKYEALFRATQKGQSAAYDALDEAAGLQVDRFRKQSEEEIALEEAKQRELTALRQRQTQRQLDSDADVARSLIQQNIGEVYGKGTGRSVIEAKRAEKAALLEVDRQYAQDTLDNAQKLTGEEGRRARAAAAAQLAIVQNAIRDVEREKAAHPAEDFLYKLVLGKEEDSEQLRQQLDETVGQALAAIQQILQADQEAAQAKIEAKTRQIDDLQRDLDRELQYNKEGSASNIATLRAEIQAAKAARREALEDQRKAAKQQQLLNDLQAVSSISLAVANVIAGWSEIPLVGSILGAVAAAAMVASFVATKTKAKSAVQSQSEGFFRGGYTGGADTREERGVVHGKEFVHTADVTEKYRLPLFEALHKGRPEFIDWSAPQMQALLPDLELPKRIKAERQEAQRVEVQHQFAPMQEKFDAMQAELKAIKQHVQTTATKPDRIPVTKGYIEFDAQSRSSIYRRLEGVE